MILTFKLGWPIVQSTARAWSIVGGICLARRNRAHVVRNLPKQIAFPIKFKKNIGAILSKVNFCHFANCGFGWQLDGAPGVLLPAPSRRCRWLVVSPPTALPAARGRVPPGVGRPPVPRELVQPLAQGDAVFDRLAGYGSTAVLRLRKKLIEAHRQPSHVHPSCHSHVHFRYMN